MSLKHPDVTARLPLEYVPQYAAMVTTSNKQVATAQQCPDYANQPGVQTTAGSVASSAKTLDTTLTKLDNARAVVAALETQRDLDAAQLRRDHDNFESAINVASAGKAPAVLAWGAEVATRTSPSPSTDAPLDVRLSTSRVSGNVTAKCKADSTAYAYLFQMGTTPTNPDAWPAPVSEGKSSHLFTGLTPGQKVYVRMALQRRKGGQSQWSGVVEILVR